MWCLGHLRLVQNFPGTQGLFHSQLAEELCFQHQEVLLLGSQQTDETLQLTTI